MKAVIPGESHPLWNEDEKMPRFGPLLQNTECDVCVVGGGIAGLTTAYLLSQEGKRVVLLESDELASGQSGRTSAHLTAVLDMRYFEIEKKHGKRGARLAAESHTAALNKIRAIAQKENINCDLEQVNAYLFAGDSSDAPLLPKELAAATRAGLSAAYLERAPISTFFAGPCLEFGGQLQFQPVKYMRGLALALQKAGGLIFTRTHVNEFGKNHVKSETGFTVKAQNIVAATNTPVNDLFAIHTKQAPYRSYVLAFRIPKGSVPKALYWDTLDPYHYVRVHSETDHDVLIVGGEDHKTGQESRTELRFCFIEQWTRARFPMAGEILHSWSGQIMESADGMAFLGHNPMDRDNVFVMTGDSGNGLTSSTIGAMLITDQIMGRENAWEKLYNPSRLTASSEFLKENANVAAQYRSWLQPRPRPDFGKMENNEGAVFRDGLDLIAAYKDEKGRVSFTSAACTHLGGVVSWNDTEKTWDCPCHGARYSPQGKVIEGPAIEGLKKIEAARFRDDILESVEKEI